MNQKPKKKRGRPKLFSTPEDLWNAFLNYKTWVEENPIKKHVFVGKDGDSAYEERQRCLSIDAFELYCFNNGIIKDFGHYFSNKDGRYDQYVAICSRIRKSTRAEQIEGGMAGIYNASITQRLNNLTESTSLEVKTMVPLFPDVK